MLPLPFQENHRREEEIQRREDAREQRRSDRYYSSSSDEEDSDDDLEPISDDDETCTCYGCLDNLAKESVRPPDPKIFKGRDLAPVQNTISVLLAKVDEFIARGQEQSKPDFIVEGLKILEWILDAMKEFRPRKGTLNRIE